MAFGVRRRLECEGVWSAKVFGARRRLDREGVWIAKGAKAGEGREREGRERRLEREGREGGRKMRTRRARTWQSYFGEGCVFTSRRMPRGFSPKFTSRQS